MRRAIWWVQDYLWAALAWLGTIGAPRTPDHYTTGSGRTIVVVPGVYENWRFLRPLILPLHQAGHAVHVLPGIGHNRAPIATGAHALLRLLVERDLHEVVVIGHSKGGLIAKLALMADQGRIDQVITICTPFHGSRLAHLLPLRSLRPLVPGHLSLELLGQEHPVNLRITSIGSRYDPHVPEGSDLPGARNVKVDVHGHHRPIGHPAVLAEIRRVLAAS